MRETRDRSWWRRLTQRAGGLVGWRYAEEPLSFHHVLGVELAVIDRKRGAGAGDSDIQSAIETLTGAIRLPHTGRLRGEVTTDPEARSVARRRHENQALQGALKRDLCGLALSGGGIRSATFNLGVIQALADLRLLRHFDYLSTVSGGGYIGSWLSALIERENRSDPGSDGIEAVERRLQTRRGTDQPVEDEAVGFLRQYSNYLSPRLGLLSADTWALLATYLRNLLLNLLVVLPGLALLLYGPWLVFAASGLLGELLEKDTCNRLFFYASLGLGMLATVAMGYSMASLVGEARSPDCAVDRRADRWLRPRALRWCLVGPLTIAAYLASRWMPGRAVIDLWVWCAGTALAYGASWALAAAVAARSRWGRRQTLRLWSWLVVTGAVCGAFAGAGLFWLAHCFEGWSEPMLAVWGPPSVLLWFIVLGVVQTGIMGRRMLDRQREWLSRLGAWLLIFAFVWTVLFAAVVHGPVWLTALAGWGKAMLASGWLVATLGGLAAGRSAIGHDATPGRLRRLLADVSPYVFIAGLVLLLALALSVGLAWATGNEADWRAVNDARHAWIDRHEALEENLARASAGDLEAASQAIAIRRELAFGTLIGNLQQHYDKLILRLVRQDPDAWFDADRRIVILVFLILAVSTSVLAWRVDVNEFSMHSLYRNRLVRAYLGASVHGATRRRNAQPFTGFFRGDDLPLAGTDAPDQREHAIDLTRRGPLHLINVALNLVGGEQLAWQERKAASFVLSPLFCGFDPPDEDDFNAALTPNIRRHGYRPTAFFADQPPRQRLSLGSAMAISGAAASPSMGFRTTAAFAFLLTVLNVRLGWWLGNPRHARTWRRSGPRLALLNLFQEISGTTRGRTRYVNVSDGGHFENLGVYELVRRRCRFIIVCDVGADPDLAFDDLGNAIRKCRSDLGADIELDLDPIRETAEGTSRWHCALGTVRYLREGETGTILYLKASVTGDEPADILNYRQHHKTFPHQSTSDQFFDESQFESYRCLGHHVITQVLEDAARAARKRTGETERDVSGWRRCELARLWQGLGTRWQSPAKAAARHPDAEDAS